MNAGTPRANSAAVSTPARLAGSGTVNTPNGSSASDTARPNGCPAKAPGSRARQTGPSPKSLSPASTILSSVAAFRSA